MEGIPNFESNKFAILQWGYETGGDLDEAIRVWSEEQGLVRRGKYLEPTPEQYVSLNELFDIEFGSEP